MGISTCFFDQKECPSSGECLACDRFPGEEKAKAVVAAKRAEDLAKHEALIRVRDTLQIDPSQFAARIVLIWDEAIYGYGSTLDKALHAAEERFVEMYNFAVRYHENQ